MIPLLDTNVLVRFLTSDENPKYSQSYAFFRSVEQGETQVELKLIVLFQTLFVLKSVYRVEMAAIADALLLLLEYKGLRMSEKRVIRHALELWRDNNLEIVDCYLIACLKKDPGNVIYSYDKDFDRFGVMRVEPSADFTD